MRYSDLYEDKFLVDRDKIIAYMSKNFDGFKRELLSIGSDGLIYDGPLYLTSNIHRLKIQFKEVTGNFYSNQTEIFSLEGYPRVVGGYFSCNTKNIPSLKFCPAAIGSDFYCHGRLNADPKEYRYALYSEIGGEFNSGNKEMDNIINTYSGAANRKYWPHAINLLSKVQL